MDKQFDLRNGQLMINKSIDNDHNSDSEEDSSSSQVSSSSKTDRNSNTENSIPSSEEGKSESDKSDSIKYFYITLLKICINLYEILGRNQVLNQVW